MPRIVTISENIKGGIPVVSGTRIPVRAVAYLNKKLKKSPSAIATKYYTQLSVDVIKEVINWFDKNSNKYGGLDLR